MAGAALISIAGAMDASFATPAAFVAHMVGRLNLEALQQGWTGARIFTADWSPEERALLVAIEPDTGGAVTADTVSAYLREKRKAETR